MRRPTTALALFCCSVLCAFRSSLQISATAGQSTEQPKVVLPPALVWNAKNRIFVRWPRPLEGSRGNMVRLNLEIFASSPQDGVSVSANAFRYDSPIILEATPPGTASEYLLRLSEIPEGRQVEFRIAGQPDLQTLFTEFDKPLYRAAETVRLRYLPITHQGNIYNGSISFKLKNPDGLVLAEKSQTAMDSFMDVSFVLPKNVKLGNWAIEVAPVVPDRQNTVGRELPFVVQNYDLPLFEVTLSTEGQPRAVLIGFLADIVVIARYSFGKPVKGTVEFVCNVNSLNAVILPSVEMIDGYYKAALDVGACVQTHGRRFELRANVRDHGTGQSEAATVQIDTQRPQLRFRLLRPAFSPDGSLLPIYTGGDMAEQRQSASVSVVCFESETSSREFLNYEEQFTSMHLLSVPSGCQAVLFGVTVDEHTTAFVVPRFDSELIDFTLLQPDSISNTNLIYSVGDRFTARVNSHLSTAYFVVCNGKHLMEHSTAPQRRIQFRITDRMIGECILITTVNDKTDILMFSVVQRCQGSRFTLNATRVKPGDSVSLNFLSNQDTLVSLVAVDERLAYLPQPQKLETISQDYQFLIEPSDANGAVIYGLFDYEANIAALDYCEQAGNLWWQEHSRCPHFGDTNSVISNECNMKFYAACSNKRIAEPTSGKVCQNSLRGCTTSPPEDSSIFKGDFEVIDMVDPQGGPPVIKSFDFAVKNIRAFFPEVWLWEHFPLSANAEWARSLTVPDSITNWTLSAHTWSRGQADVCALPPRTLTTFKAFFLHVDLPRTAVVGEEIHAVATVFQYGGTVARKVYICVQMPTGVCADRGYGGEVSREYSIAVPESDSTSSHTNKIPVKFLQAGIQTLTFALHKEKVHARACDSGDRLDAVEYTVDVRPDSRTWEYYKSFVMTPAKPRHATTLIDFEDEILHYREKKLSGNGGKRKLTAKLFVTPSQVEGFRLEVSHFFPSISLPPNPDSTTRSKRSSAPFLTDILKQFSIELYDFKLLSMRPEPIDEAHYELVESSLGQLVGDTMTYGDCGVRRDKCGYSALRWPANDKDRSLSLTVLTTMLHCEAGVNPTIVCPALRWIIEQATSMAADFEETKLETPEDEERLMDSLIMLVLFECDAYTTAQCDDLAESVRPVASRLYQRFYEIDENESDPVALAAVTYITALAGSPLFHVYQHYLYNQVAHDESVPYWHYNQLADEAQLETGLGFWKVVSWIKGAPLTAKERVAQSNQMLMNAFGFLSFLDRQTQGLNLEMEPLADYFFDVKNKYGSFVGTLDTIIANKALFKYMENMVLSSNSNLTIRVKCSGCDQSVRQVTKESTVIYVPSSSKNVTVTVSGSGKVRLGVRLVLSESPRTAASGEEWLLPVKIASDSRTDNHTVCLNTNQSTLKDLFVEHGIFTGMSANLSSFLIKGSMKLVGQPDATSHYVHIMLTDITPSLDHCYEMSFVESTDNIIHSPLAPVPVMAKHQVHGLVGRTYMHHKEAPDDMLPDGSSQVDTLCFGGGASSCVCAESACAASRYCGECREENSLNKTLNLLCRDDYFGIGIRAKSMETVQRSGIEYSRISASISLTWDSGDLLKDCSKCEIWMRKCVSECPLPRAEKLYLLYGHSANWRVDFNSTLPVYLFSEGDGLESMDRADCPDAWISHLISISNPESLRGECRNRRRVGV